MARKKFNQFLIGVMILFVFVFCLGFISAEGCCFDSVTGICTPNALETNCNADLGGQFFSSLKCEISECNVGCCVVGASTSMTTPSECQVKTSVAGLSIVDFRDVSLEQCALLQDSEQEGACVLGPGNFSDCKITTSAQCSGNFSAGLTCIDVPSRCKKTDKSTCYKGDVYSLDSCGNVAKKLSDCDYASGTMCKQVDIKTAECKSLDCSDPEDVPLMEGPTSRPNGARWCIGPLTDAYRDYDVNNPLGNNLGNAVTYARDASGNIVVNWPEVYSEGITNPTAVYSSDSGSTYSTTAPSGSGEVYVGISGDSSTNKPSVYVKIPDGSNEGSFEAYEIYGKDGAPVQGYILNIPPSAKIMAGADFFSAYCLDGKVYIEACNPAGGRSAYCWGSGKEDPASLGSTVASENSEDSEDSSITGNAVRITGNAVNSSVSVPDFESSGSGPARTGGKCVKNTGNECLGIEDSGECNNNPACYWLDGVVFYQYYPWSNQVEECYKYSQGTAGYSKPVRAEPLNSSWINPFTLTEGVDKEELLFPKLAQCMPKIPVGGEFLAASSSTSSSSDCETASFEVDEIVHTISGSGYDSTQNMIDLCWAGWDHDNDCNQHASEAQILKCKILGTPNLLYGKTMNWSSNFWGLLEEKTKAIGDCSGDINYREEYGTETPLIKPEFLKKGIKFGDFSNKASAEREAGIWRPPASSSCSRGCPAPVCSEYMCKAQGKNCDFKEIDAGNGRVMGTCFKSDDLSPPQITGHSLNPESPIPPYSSVEITITTNELSLCSFSLNGGPSSGSTNRSSRSSNSSSSGSSGNSFGEGFATEHKIILSVPGKLPAEVPEDVPEYNLIANDGKYEMFVKCEDVAGNENLVPYVIKFEVMQGPDTLEPVISSFTPASESYLSYNVTSQTVSLKLNEPAECKWDSIDTDYYNMSNSFSCDISPSDKGLLNGYYCSGTLTNVTLNLLEKTTYYIRCKDQPWLEGKEDGLFVRNVNLKSKSYVLKPSNYLSALDIRPNGTYIVGPNIVNFSLTTKTLGGAESGKASCSWKYNLQNMSTSYYPFTNTNSSTHSVVINNNLTEGNYLFQVKCTDVAGNIAYTNSTVQLRVDRISPIITRVFNDKGNLKIATNEPASCKYMFAGGSISCLFSRNSGNLTSMYGNSSLEHTTPWRKGSTYLVKCADFYGNENSDCGMIIKAY